MGYRQVTCNPLNLLARPKGFEPLAKSLEGSHSIRLSYGRLFAGFVQGKQAKFRSQARNLHTYR